MEDLEIVLQKRKLRSNRNLQSIYNLYEKLERALMVLRYTEKIIGKNAIKIKSESRRQFVISLVTAFETYLGDITVEIIDSGKISYDKNLFNNIGAKYDILEIDSIIKNKITIGELVLNEISFQNISRTFSFLNNLFKIDFSGLIDGSKFRFINAKNKEVTLCIRRGFAKRLSRIFNSRHQFVHDIKFNNTPSLQELKDYYKLIRSLATCIDVKADELRGINTSKVIKK